jgi:2-oxoisovalerate dehydrogenase E1 component
MGKDAVAYCREQRKPVVLRIQTDRLMAHSKGDDDRPKELLTKFWERDVLTIFQKKEPKAYAEYEQRAKDRIDAAVEAGLTAPFPEIPPTISHDRQHLSWQKIEYTETKRINELLRDCFMRNMEQNKQIVLIGEDISDPYGGAFKVSKGLSTAYPDRVLSTTISEAAITGIGNGLALDGMLPICEIMFGDFLTLAFDQIINHAAKFPFMYNHKIKNPIIIRTPMGGGRGYGPTHSQSLEKHFLGIPQTTVLSLNYRYNPAELYDTVFQNIDGPVLIFEDKFLYTQRLSTSPEPGFIVEKSDELWPTVRVRPEAEPDITIICYGGSLMLAEKIVLEAFDNHEIVGEIICPSCLYPMDTRAIIESLSRTRKLLIIEEGYSFAAWGSEIIARIIEQDSTLLQKVHRLSMPEYPIPCSGPLEKQVLPNLEQALNYIKELMNNE